MAYHRFRRTFATLLNAKNPEVVQELLRHANLKITTNTHLLEQARRKAIELDAGKAGMEIAETEEGSRIRVRDAVAAYLKEIDPPQRNPRLTPHTNIACNCLLRIARRSIFRMS